MNDVILKEHGNGGKQMHELISNVFKKSFNNIYLEKADDSTKVDLVENSIAISTDSFVVKPIFFNGGNIGKLSICGVSNDILVSGYIPKYFTVSFIIEEGFSIEKLKQISCSMREYADFSNAYIVAGDTKVVEKGSCDNIFINVAGIGVKRDNFEFADVNKGQVIIVSGDIGRHGACIYSHISELGFSESIKSDCALLIREIDELCTKFPNKISYMKDLTRGGLATALNEISNIKKVEVIIEEKSIPVDLEVQGLCDILGLDPLYLACEGRFVVLADEDISLEVLNILKKYNKNASVVGFINNISEKGVYLNTEFGGTRYLDMLYFEMLPRIC